MSEIDATEALRGVTGEDLSSGPPASVSDEYLEPIWRLRPDRPGPCAIALDPREAAFVLENGATLDGLRYTASLQGWDGTPDSDGRISVRLDPEIGESRSWVDAGGHSHLEVVDGFQAEAV